MSHPTFDTWAEAIKATTAASALDEQLQALMEDITEIADGTYPEETSRIIGDDAITFFAQSSGETSKVVLIQHR